MERHGSFAFTALRLRHQPTSVRQLTGSTLVATLRIRVRPLARISGTASCREVAPREGPIIRATLAPPGAIVRAAAGGPVWVGRFGALRPQRLYELAVRSDRSSVPWTLSVPRGVSTLCTG